MRNVTRTNRKVAANSTYPKGWVSFSKDSFVVNGSSVIQLGFFAGLIPKFRDAPKPALTQSVGTLCDMLRETTVLTINIKRIDRIYAF
jgi:hypothetical protein